MKTFEAKFKKNLSGVFAISLVKKPATQENFIALSEDEKVIKLTEINKEERILMGLVLQPNQLIYRRHGDNEFNIVFSEDTIKELSHNFFKKGFQLNSKLEHEAPIDGVTFVESWIVENSSIDKSTNYGMSYPKGSWIATMKVDNDDIWNNYIKTGDLLGFSVDAMVDLEEVNFKTDIEMTEEKKSLLEKMELWFTENILNKKEIKLGSTISGDVKIEFDGETLEKGSSLFVMAEDEKVPLPDGEYPTDDYGVIMAKDGILEDFKKESYDEKKEEKKEDEKVEMKNDNFEELMKLLMSKQEESFNSRLEAIKLSYQDEIKSLKSEVVTLKEQPASNPIVSTPTQVELNSSGKLLEKLRNNKN